MNMNIKFKFPTNIFSNNVVKYVLYVITLALAVSYIINEENVALLSLALIASGIYVMNKNIVIALLISISVTNLLLSMNYFKNTSILENVQNIVTCCSGQPFYTDYKITYNAIINNIQNQEKCQQLDTEISSRTTPLDEIRRAEFLEKLYENNDYMKAKSICNTLKADSSIYGMEGSLFKKNISLISVLDDPDMLPNDILNIIESSNIRTNSNLSEANKQSLSDAITKLEAMDATLRSRARTNNFQIPTSLTSNQESELEIIKTTLKRLFDLTNINLITKLDISYNLLNKNPSGNTYQPVPTYILTKNKYIDCSGTIKTGNTGGFSLSDRLELSNNDFFGTSGIPVSRGGLGDASYNPYGTQISSELYPSNRDLEMELRRLETLPSSGNVPVNVISTYLNAINTFFEKQIQNLTSTRSSTFSQTPINDIYSIRTMKPTFFTYDNTSNNNNYQCENSITGNPAFKNCGPAAYYEIPKF